MRDIRVAAVQYEHAPGAKDTNLATVGRYVAEAARAGVEILVFPECCLTGYWFLRHLSRKALVDLAEPVPDGPLCQRLLDMSRRYALTIGAGLVELSRDGQLYNAYVVAMPDGHWRCHRKLHCFVSPHMASGDEYTVFDSPHGCRLGVLTCYDNNIGENVRATALMGAEILIAPHQTGGCRSSNPHTMGLIERVLWENRTTDPEAIKREFLGPKGREWLMRWLPARAHDNGLFLVFSNGVGIDDDEVRTGNAMILDPYGRVLAETWAAADAMVMADLEASLRIETTGERWIRTRRPELYDLLCVSTGREQDTRQVRFDAKGV